VADGSVDLRPLSTRLTRKLTTRRESDTRGRESTHARTGRLTALPPPRLIARPCAARHRYQRVGDGALADGLAPPEDAVPAAAREPMIVEDPPAPGRPAAQETGDEDVEREAGRQAANVERTQCDVTLFYIYAPPGGSI